MSAEQGANVVTNGLVLSLDAGNPKSYSNVVQYLIVGGGGAGGSHVGGGGGGGGVLQGSITLTTASHSIVVGAGGTSTGGDTRGNSGQSSSAFGLTAIGGGGGGTYSGLGNANGISGGSGGGAAGTDGTTTATGGLGTAGQGFAGGSVGQRTGGASDTSGAGGGGASQAAFSRVNAYDSMQRNGGDGISTDITGTVRFFGGGGGSGSFNARVAGNGGRGGGGGGGSTGSTAGLGDTNSINNASNGASGSGALGGAGAANSGGGGGGGAGGSTPASTAAGGSGIVVIRYPGAARATGGTITTVGTDTVHTFTSSGTLLFSQANTTYWSNLSGTTGHGVLTNGITYSSSNGGYLIFDGVDDFVLGSITASTFSSAHSISCWFYRRTVTQWAGLFSNNVNTNSCSLLTFIDSTNSIGINNAGVSNAGFSVDLGTHLNKWIYCTIVFNGATSGSSGTVYAYKDGALLTGTGTLSWNLTTNSQYYVGRHYTGGNQILDGFIPQVSVYNRALSATEVLQNYNATKGRYGL
jgi:hypothetical protein